MSSSPPSSEVVESVDEVMSVSGGTAEVVEVERKLYNVQLNDGTIFKDVDATRCGTLKNLIDDIDEEDCIIPLNNDNITKKIFKYILKFMEMHPALEDNITLATEEERQQVLRVPDQEEADIAFFKAISLQNLNKLIMAANYLDFKLLLEYICKNIGHTIRVKTAEDINKITGDDPSVFTDEEKAEALKAQPWLKEFAAITEERHAAKIAAVASTSGGGGIAESSSITTEEAMDTKADGK